MTRVKISLIFLFIGFLSPVCLIAEELTEVTTKEELDYRKERDKIRDERFEEKQEKEEKAQKREEKAKKAQSKQEMIKKREERCDKAYEDVQQALKDQKEEKQEWEDKFYDLESDITDLEKKHLEEQLKTKELLEKLKKDSAQNTQDLKDTTEKELKNIDKNTANQIQFLEKALDSLNEALAKVEETRMTVFFNRRKQQNNNYSACFGQALKQTEAERSKFYAKKQRGTLRQKSLKTFVSGSKSKTKNTYNQRFNQLLNLCLNNKTAQLRKENEKQEHELTLTKLNRQEERIQTKITKIKNQIKTLGEQSKHQKVALLNQNKEKMEANLEAFEQNYDSTTKRGKQKSEQILTEINKIKKRQAQTLAKRNQVVPQNKRAKLVLSNCQQTDQAFNLYPIEQILGSSNSRSSRIRNTYRNRNREGRGSK